MSDEKKLRKGNFQKVAVKVKNTMEFINLCIYVSKILQQNFCYNTV